ncbi:MAG: SIS domain-containing protein [Candidatus Koribacter versatilis]|nr:SIS domain-containing protein [Candidatus Koribacter versatilis]
MLEDLAVIEGEYLRDILHQPQALENTLAGLEPSKPLQDLAARLNKGRFHRVVLTGMGASFHALHPLNLELISHGFTALMVETSELVHYKSQFFDPKTLIVAVSQSGQSAEMVRLVQTNHKRGAVIAITNTPGSPLARHADAAVLTQAGNEFSVSCKTYVTALMALKWLGDVLCERDLRRTRQELKHACPAAAAYLADWKACVRTLAALLKDIRHLFLVGRGASLATVGTGALIVKESDHFHAEGMSSAAFRHGPFEMLSKETFVLVFAGDTKTRDLNQRLLSDILQEEGRAELVDRDAPSPSCRLGEHTPAIRQILEILPVQMITLALAAQAGREPGRFVLATKVTTTE